MNLNKVEKIKIQTIENFLWEYIGIPNNFKL